jgi:hypothetical protein
MANPGTEHWQAIQLILKYLCGSSNAYLCFGKSGDGLFGYVDLDYAGDFDRRRSLSRYVFTIGGCAMSWKACLQATVAMSTIEAEYMAIAEAMDEGLCLEGLYFELCGVKSSITIYCDNHSAIYLTKDHMLKVCKISTHDNHVDMMTKHVLVSMFEIFSNLGCVTH